MLLNCGVVAGRGRERCTRPSPGRPAAGTALSQRRSPALPRPGGFLPLHPPPGRLPRRAWPILGLLRAMPPPHAHLASDLRPWLLRGLWTWWPGRLLLLLVSSVLCICPTPRAEQPGRGLCVCPTSACPMLSQVVPGWQPRHRPARPGVWWTVPPQHPIPAHPRGPGPSPPTPGALAGRGWGAWVPLVLPESGA